MARPPLARERVLDAFEAILIDEGGRAATLDAVARRAGVSKGGLLYHFASKDDLAAGLVNRLDTLTDADLERMADSPEGPVTYYIRTSVMEDDALDRAIVATTRLAQGGSAIATAAGTPSSCAWEAASTAPRRCVESVATCVSSVRCSAGSSGRHLTPRQGCADGSPIAPRRSESSDARSKRSARSAGIQPAAASSSKSAARPPVRMSCPRIWKALRPYGS